MSGQSVADLNKVNATSDLMGMAGLDVAFVPSRNQRISTTWFDGDLELFSRNDRSDGPSGSSSTNKMEHRHNLLYKR